MKKNPARKILLGRPIELGGEDVIKKDVVKLGGGSDWIAQVSNSDI